MTWKQCYMRISNFFLLKRSCHGERCLLPSWSRRSPSLSNAKQDAEKRFSLGCLLLTHFLETVKTHDSFRNSEWSSEAAESMCKEVRHFKLPVGNEGKVVTMGNLFDKTPKDLISKVMLEEKLFDTWYGGRTVLLGDCKRESAFCSIDDEKIRNSEYLSSYWQTIFIFNSVGLLGIACHKVRSTIPALDVLNLPFTSL